MRRLALALLIGLLLPATGRGARPIVGAWVDGSRLPTARTGLSAVVVDGTIYALGGVGQARNASLATVEAYDIEHRDWRATAGMAVDRVAFGATAFGGSILVAGGASRRGGAFLRAVETYNPALDVWTDRAGLARPQPGRQGLAVAKVGNRVVAVGGIPGVRGARVAAAAQSYDFKLNQWTLVASMPTARTGLAAEAVDGKLYAIGGSDTDGPVASVEEYDPARDRWVRKRDMPTPRAFCASTVANGRIYVIGGVDHQWGAPSRVVEVYDPRQDGWRRVADLPSPRIFAAAVAHAGRIYVLGGQDRPGPAPVLDSVLVYDTGFRGPFSVSPRDTLITTWSSLKVE